MRKNFLYVEKTEQGKLVGVMDGKVLEQIGERTFVEIIGPRFEQIMEKYKVATEN